MAPPNDNLPESFNAWEHLQGQYIAEFNRLVRKYFSDHDVDWKPNLDDKRSSMRVACTMLDSDNHAMMNLRMSFFFDLLGYNKKNLLVYYGSKENIEPPVVGHPKIVFYFLQDAYTISATQDFRGEAEYSLRLMQLQNTSTNLLSKLTEIANEIKTQFVDSKRGIILTKGNLGVIYKDPKNGFSSGRKILSSTENDAIDIYRRMCNVIDVPFDEEKITVANPKKASTTGSSTETQIVLGKTRRKPVYRPIVSVRFQYAYASIPGEPNPVFLVDTTYRHKPLVRL